MKPIQPLNEFPEYKAYGKQHNQARVRNRKDDGKEDSTPNKNIEKLNLPKSEPRK